MLVRQHADRTAMVLNTKFLILTAERARRRKDFQRLYDESREPHWLMYPAAMTKPGYGPSIYTSLPRKQPLHIAGNYADLLKDYIHSSHMTSLA